MFSWNLGVMADFRQLGRVRRVPEGVRCWPKVQNGTGQGHGCNGRDQVRESPSLGASS